MKHFLLTTVVVALIFVMSCRDDCECPVECDYSSDWRGSILHNDGPVSYNSSIDANTGSITLDFKVTRVLTSDVLKEGRMMVFVHHSYGDLGYDYIDTKTYDMDEQAEIIPDGTASEIYYEYLSLNGEPGWLCTFTGNYSEDCNRLEDLPSFKLTFKDINPLEGAKFNIWVGVDGPHSMRIQQRMLLII